MIDPNLPEAIAVRRDQEDPIVMYLIVRESLEMGVGKTAAQCAHASQMLLLKYIKATTGNSDWFQSQPDWEISTNDNNWIYLFRDWLSTSFRKVTLKADDKEWAKIKELPNHIVVVDAGLTEIAAGSETCIGFMPIKKSQRSKLIKKLQVLK